MAPVRVLVTIHHDVDLERAMACWRELGFAETSIMRDLGIVAGVIDSNALAQLSADPTVKAVEPEREVRTLR